jgi:hypothetical protein
MRVWLLLVAAAACAQDNRGFVNHRLVTQNFVKNSLKPKSPLVLMDSPMPRCAIPLLQIPASRDVDPKMVITPRKDSGDDKMILPVIPVCPAK